MNKMAFEKGYEYLIDGIWMPFDPPKDAEKLNTYITTT